MDFFFQYALYEPTHNYLNEIENIILFIFTFFYSLVDQKEKYKKNIKIKNDIGNNLILYKKRKPRKKSVLGSFWLN